MDGNNESNSNDNDNQGNPNSITNSNINNTLTISFPPALPTNTWRRVFTSLRPFVSRTRNGSIRRNSNRLESNSFSSIASNLASASGNAQSPVSPPPVERSDDFVDWPQDGAPLTASPPSTSGVSSTVAVEEGVTDGVAINMESGCSSCSSMNPVVEEQSEEPQSETGRDLEPSSPLLAGNGTDSSSNEDEDTQSNNNNSGNGQSGNSESLSDLLNQFPEVRNVLLALWQYCIFFLIILAKGVFDHIPGISVMFLHFLIFIVCNKVVKVYIGSQRHFIHMMFVILVIPIIFVITYFYHECNKIYYSALLLPPDFESITLGDLLWIVIITDYTLKLVTVLIKDFVAILPQIIIKHQNRGKVFFLIEMMSQLYRSLAPVQPWMSYLLDNYSGARKVLGVFLSATYMICKGPDLLIRLKNLQTGIIKCWCSTNYGIVPSKEQVQDAGGLCPICHDNFLLPTMLHCKHIFCEQCVVTWFDRERTCPMCRTKVADDPKWRDGGTSHYVQLY